MNRSCDQGVNHIPNFYVTGRAWLYLALTDHLLESYLRCFSSDQSLVRKYYVKEALVADQQQMELLLMLSAGLEHLQFQLELVCTGLLLLNC